MGPLAGVKVLELAGVGPGPMCAMLLADLGATVLRIDRRESSGLGIARPLHANLLLRGRRVIALDLKKPEAIELVLKLAGRSDALIEGFRPGVTERLGLGPDSCLARNPKLVYGRITGWGQTGPLAQSAGHDINYIAVTGALNAIGRQGQPPTTPMNVLGDYAGGGLYLALGLLSGIIEARSSGQGQVVDAAIVDGTASLMTNFHGMRIAGLMSNDRGTNISDTGAYFYDVYECADGLFVSIGPIEAKFHAELLRLLAIDPAGMPPQNDRAGWPRAREIVADKIRTRTREEWTALLQGTDACFAPVLTLDEAPSHPHLKARGTYVEIDGIMQPAPAPRFSRTVPETPIPPQQPAEGDALEIALAPWLGQADVAELRAAGTFG